MDTNQYAINLFGFSIQISGRNGQVDHFNATYTIFFCQCRERTNQGRVITI